MSNVITELESTIAAEHDALANHPVFSAISDMEQLRGFMEWHVFAVWDFMSLLKRLQRELTNMSLPWMPPASTKAARLINEIVLGEETDEALGSGHMSHYELYLHAMRDVGADTEKVERFLLLLGRGVSVEQALSGAEVDEGAARFVRATLDTATTGSVHEVLGSFFYGRENVIPAMFRTLLERWQIEPASAPMFVYYLERHIELDSEEHGPAAESIITEIVGSDQVKRRALLESALRAVRQRRQLWDSLFEQIQAGEMLAAAN